MFPLRRSNSPVKKPKPVLKEAHTQFTSTGSGDYYGTASKNPMGRVRDVTLGFKPVTPKQMKTRPRSLA